MFAISFLGCKTSVQESPYKVFKLTEFDLQNGYIFVEQIEDLKAIENISIVDLKTNGKEFEVNEQHIFTDTTYIDQPNFYSYVRRAKEIGISKNDLLESLKKFYGIKVNEFQRADKYYIFKVEKFLNTNEKGYLYTKKEKLKLNDTISYFKYVTRKLKIQKQIDEHWFEYEEINYH